MGVCASSLARAKFVSFRFPLLPLRTWCRNLPVVSARNPLPRMTLISSWVGCMKLDEVSSGALYVDTNVWYMYLRADAATRPILTTFVGRVVRGVCDAFVGIPVLDELFYRLLLARVQDATGRHPLEELRADRTGAIRDHGPAIDTALRQLVSLPHIHLVGVETSDFSRMLGNIKT